MTLSCLMFQTQKTQKTLSLGSISLQCYKGAEHYGFINPAFNVSDLTMSQRSHKLNLYFWKK